jgi:uncharacterized protein DUF6941
MKLTLGLLADAANVTADGKINILGEFNLIKTQQFPAGLPSFSIVFRLEAAGNEPSEHTFGIRLLDDDEELVRPIADGTFTLGPAAIPGLPRRLQGIVPVALATFERPGTFRFDILVDGTQPERECAPIEVHVVEIPATGAPT